MKNINFNNGFSSNLVFDNDMYGSSIIVENSRFYKNSITGFTLEKVTILNSTFEQNIAPLLVYADSAVIYHSTFIDENFGKSYIRCNRSLQMESNSFQNITYDGTDIGNKFSGSVLLIQDDSLSNNDNILGSVEINNLNFQNSTVNQFLDFNNCNMNISNVYYNFVHGLAGKLSQTDDFSSTINLNNFTIIKGENTSITIIGRNSSILTTNICFSEYIGDIYPINIDNIGKLQANIINITLLSSSRAIFGSGNISISNLQYNIGTSSKLSPFLFYGDNSNSLNSNYNNSIIQMNNIELNDIFISNSDISIFYFSKKAIINATDIKIINCKSPKASIIHFASESQGIFHNLNCTSNFGGSSGCILLETGSIEFYDSYFYDNMGKLGGAMLIRYGNLFIENSIIESNRAEYGGGLYLQESHINWINSSCIDNVSFQDGGCLFTRNIVRGFIDSVSILSNQCLGSGGGIALRNFNEIKFNKTIIANNIGLNGGGLYISGNSTSLFNFGSIINNYASSSGGGIFIKEQATPIINNTIISFNHADSTGGGIKIADNSNPYLNNLIISNNSSPNEGGGISYSDSSIANLENSLLLNNYVNSSGGGIVFSISTHGLLKNIVIQGNSAKSKGGGIAFYNQCYTKFENVSILNNTAPEGAGISSKDIPSPCFINCLFKDNYSSSSGGAMVVYDYSKGSYINCTFDNNSGGGGGGAIVLNDFSNVLFENCTFSRNYAQRGGAIFISTQRNISLHSCYFLNNYANYGGALLFTDQSNILMYSSICSGNIATSRGGCVHIEDDAKVFFYNLQLNDNSAALDSGIGNGGAISIADRSFVHLINCSLVNNTSIVGGGVFIEQFANIQGENNLFSLNKAVEGGAVFTQSISIYFINSLFKNNSVVGSIARGGAISIISIDYMENESPICVNCLFENNTALCGRGGAIFVSIHARDLIIVTYNEKDENSLLSFDNLYVNSNNELELSSSNTNYDSHCQSNYYYSGNVDFITPLLQNVSFIENKAKRGGGVYYEQPNSDIGLVNATFLQNEALEFGGGIFIFGDRTRTTNAETWMAESYFSNNNAFYGGSNIGWSVTDSCSSNFCSNCFFGSPDISFDGYDNNNGWASPPVDLIFASGCPTNITLSNNSFDVILQLIDKFSTSITGHFVEENNIIVSVTTSSNCMLNSTLISSTTNDSSSSTVYSNDTSNEVSFQVNSVGKVSFENIMLEGYNNQTCSLYFFVSSDNAPFVGNLTCDIVFNGCAKNEIVSTPIPGEFDTCIANVSQEQTINQAIFLLLLIFVLLVFICIVGCISIFWQKYMVMKPKPFIFIPPSSNDKLITLEDLLSDPEIPSIPWDSIQLGNRIGHGATGLVLDGFWQNGTNLIDIALKEVQFNSFSDTSEKTNLYSKMITEIRLMG